MPFYECVFIARQDISASQVEHLSETFAAIIRDNGGQVTKTENWGLRNLTYKVKKNRKGHYVFFNLDAPPAAVAEMERNMRINEDVLRTLTVRVEALEAGPSAMMQARNERSERGERGGRRGDGERPDREHRGDRGERGERSGRPPRRMMMESSAEGSN